MHTPSPAIDRLVTPSEYQAARARIFPSEASLRWHLRVNRSELVAGGALLRVAGRLLVDPERLDALVMAIATRAEANDSPSGSVNHSTAR